LQKKISLPAIKGLVIRAKNSSFLYLDSTIT